MSWPPRCPRPAPSSPLQAFQEAGWGLWCSRCLLLSIAWGISVVLAKYLQFFKELLNSCSSSSSGSLGPSGAPKSHDLLGFSLPNSSSLTRGQGQKEVVQRQCPGQAQNLVLFDRAAYGKLWKDVTKVKLMTPAVISGPAVVSERLEIRGPLAGAPLSGAPQ